jgi:hypothetical protein
MMLRLNEGEIVTSCFPVVDDQGETPLDAAGETPPGTPANDTAPDAIIDPGTASDD